MAAKPRRARGGAARRLLLARLAGSHARSASSAGTSSTGVPSVPGELGVAESLGCFGIDGSHEGSPAAARVGGVQSAVFERTVSTGTGDMRTIFSATLPRIARPTPRRPWVPITTRSGLFCSMTERTSRHATPRARMPLASGSCRRTSATSASSCSVAALLDRRQHVHRRELHGAIAVHGDLPRMEKRELRAVLLRQVERDLERLLRGLAEVDRDQDLLERDHAP